MNAPRQLRFWLIGTIVFFVALYVLNSVLLPFVLGMAIAYFFDPVCDRLEEFGWSRTLATSLVTAVFVLILILLLVVILPAVVAQLIDLMNELPNYIESLRGAVNAWVARMRLETDPVFFEKIQESLSGSAGQIASWAASAIGGVLAGGLALLNFISLLVLTPVVAFFLLRDWDYMVDKIDNWLPRQHAPTIRDLAGQIDTMLAGWVRGVGIVCLVLATFYCIALTLAGLNSALIVGLVAGFLSFIPFVGAAIGLVASVGLALLQFDSYINVLIVAAIFGLGQVIEGNYLTPKLVGERVGLHPVIVIFALLAGGVVFGFTGVLLAVPLAAVIGVLGRFAINLYLKSDIYDPRAAAAETGPKDPKDDSAADA
ncbi:MAG: AI-2E family transporter [Rhodovibrionaceae bacterium]